jgi:hypothetical protein
VRFRSLVFSLAFLAAVGCKSTSPSTPVLPQSSVHTYNGTASVGDFLTISLDSTAHTLTYSNHSNGDAGTIPYTVNSDATYTLNDPSGNLLAAYEVPGYALLLQAAKTGPNHDNKALVIAVQSSPVTIATLENHNYNYMQFRTAAGGIEAGSISVDATGGVSISSFWPFGVNDQKGPFNTGGFPGNSFTEDASGNFIVHDDGQGSFDYMFGTQNGIFAVDTPNGAVLGLLKASTKDFDPTFTGTYNAIFYQKTGASTGEGNVETGTPGLGNATLVVGATGSVTLKNSQNVILAQGTLAPVADTSYLYGSSGQLNDPCFGLFTFRVSTPTSQQDVFLTFQGHAVLFSYFRATLPFDPSNAYDYLYGAAIK